MAKSDLLAGALDEFLAVSPDVEGAAIVSADGLAMASALPPGVEEDRLAAMSAALLTLGERAADGLGKGELSQVFVEGRNGYVVLMQAGADAVLVGVTSKSAKVGLVLFEMRKAASTIGRVMEEPAHVPAAQGDSQPQPQAQVQASAPAAAPAPVRVPEPEPAAETEPHIPSWQ